jgi:hypothetical protein
MNLAQYNALTGDTKLAAALAIAMGWKVIKYDAFDGVHVANNSVLKNDGTYYHDWFRIFNPFADASIPYGLLCNGVDHLTKFQDGKIKAYVFGHYSTNPFTFVSKTHAIVLAYIAADPMGHLAKFLKGE